MLVGDLFEAVPQATKLYHGTDVLSAARILLENQIVGLTDHLIFSGEKGVSLTRSFRFAVDWKGGAGVVFELDGSMLRTRYRLKPFDYYRDRREAEEFLFGTIKPLEPYLFAIYMSPETRDYCIAHDSKLIEGHKDYEQLLLHPLLQVKRFPPQVPYHNPRKL